MNTNQTPAYSGSPDWSNSSLLLLVALCLCSGCRPGGSPGQPHRPQVAGIIFQEDQFFRMIELGMKDAAARRGVELLVGNSSGALDREASLVEKKKSLPGVLFTRQRPEEVRQYKAQIQTLSRQSG